MAKHTRKNFDKKVKEQEELREKTGERVSGEPDSNLDAVGGGGIAGAATGGVIGTALGGPIGGAIGAAAGAIAGAAAADKIADVLDPKVEETYWKKTYRSRPYYREGLEFEEYLPAYRLGWEIASEEDYKNHDFEQSEHELRNRWQLQQENSNLQWEEVRLAMKDAFDRIRKMDLLVEKDKEKK
jgi:uncharacterized protein YcfJ